MEDLGRGAQEVVDGVVRTLRDGASGRHRGAGRDWWTWSAPPVRWPSIPRWTSSSSFPRRLSVDQQCADTAQAVIREGLTNATRHGTGSATLRLNSNERSVCIELRNPIRRGVLTAPQRAGLGGLQERVLLADGQITAGPEGGDSWLLTARLPISRPAPIT